jgi:hypothetical protein
MDWLLDNFGKLLPVVLMLLYFLLNKGKKPVEDEEGGAGAEGSEEDDRVRRIQDEIRRRILERQQGESPQPAVPPPVLVEERPLHSAQRGGFHEEQPQPVTTLRPEWARQEEASRRVLDEQAKLADRLAQARRMAVTRTADAKVWDMKSQFGSSTMGRVAKRQGEVISPLRRSLLKDLAAPDGLRRAVLLREVLGEPIGMRRDSNFQR